MTIRIRFALESDINEISRLYNELCDYHLNFDSKYYNYPKPLDTSHLLPNIKNKQVIVVELGKQLIGYLFFIKKTENSIELMDMYINPKHQNKSIGRRLYNFFEHNINNPNLLIELNVDVDNPAFLNIVRHEFKIASELVLN